MRLVVVGTLMATLFGLPFAAVRASAGVEEFNVGGRLMWDQIAWGSVDDELGLDAENGTEVRRARLCAGGRVYSRMRFKAEWDFADGDRISLKDAYMELLDVPVAGNLRAGHMYEPFCMNELTSSKYITFVERASLTTFAPSFNSGLMSLGNAGRRVRWQAGVFIVTDESAASSGSRGRSIAGRLGVLAAGEESSPRTVHLGAAANYLLPEGDVVRFSARPGIHMSDRIVDTGRLLPESVLRLGFEAAAVLGRAHVAGEYAAATLSDLAPEASGGPGESSGGDASLAGFYAQAGIFLTGEHRRFEGGQWQRVKPGTNFLEGGGLGAWEIAVRYSSLDLNDADAGVAGGSMDDVTVGVNWYMHSNVRLMLNYVVSTVSDADDEEIGSVSAVVLRYQFDF